MRPGDGTGAERQVTKGGSMFRFAPRWSPDSKKLAFADKTYTLRWCDVATGSIHDVDKGEAPDLTDFSWSGDSRWIAYARPMTNGLREVRLYSLDGGKVTRVSDGMCDDSSPSFDPDGRYLYFVSGRTFTPEFGATEFDFHFTGTQKLYAATLRDTLKSPVAPQSDEEAGEAKDGDKGGDDKAAGGKDAKKDKAKGKDAKGAADDGPKAWVVNLEGRRVGHGSSRALRAGQATLPEMTWNSDSSFVSRPTWIPSSGRAMPPRELTRFMQSVSQRSMPA